MSEMLDCSSCGGPFPEGRRCCPHCHCKYSPGKGVKLAIAAAISLGAAACGDDTQAQPAYGIAIPNGDLSATPHDLAVNDLSKKD